MLNAAYTDDEYCFDKSVLGIISNSRYSSHFILAVINSEVMSWVFPRVSNKIISSFVTGSFPRIQVSDARKLPIPQINFDQQPELEDKVCESIMNAYESSLDGGDVGRAQWHLIGASRAGYREAVHDAVTNISRDLCERYQERSRLNTDLLSYIEPFEAAGTLQEIAQPVKGIQDMVLTEKGYEPQYEIAEFKITEEPDSVLLQVVVENDSDDEDSEGDETVSVYRFWNLSDSEIRLLREFLPVALEKSRNKTYAGFLPHTTSRNSLIDRLRDLEIPDIDDIKVGFNQYLDEADQWTELNMQIQIGESLIDKSVCALHGLDKEDLEVLEAGLQEQEG